MTFTCEALPSGNGQVLALGEVKVGQVHRVDQQLPGHLRVGLVEDEVLADDADQGSKLLILWRPPGISTSVASRRSRS